MLKLLICILTSFEEFTVARRVASPRNMVLVCGTTIGHECLIEVGSYAALRTLNHTSTINLFVGGLPIYSSFVLTRLVGWVTGSPIGSCLIGSVVLGIGSDWLVPVDPDPLTNRSLPVPLPGPSSERNIDCCSGVYFNKIILLKNNRVSLWRRANARNVSYILSVLAQLLVSQMLSVWAPQNCRRLKVACKQRFVRWIRWLYTLLVVRTLWTWLANVLLTVVLRLWRFLILFNLFTCFSQRLHIAGLSWKAANWKHTTCWLSSG